MNKRHKIFFIAAAAAMLIMLLRMAFLASAYGNTYRQEASAMATLKGELAARRGSIYDEKGQLIAWSERCYDLVYDPQRTVGNRFAKVQLLLKTHLPTARPLTTPGVERMLKTNLTAAELEIADELNESYPELDIVLRWERRIAANRTDLGEVRQIDSAEIGISGLEKEYNSYLQGTPGKFEVMLDRHGRWLNTTFRIITPPKNGNDLYLKNGESAHAATP